MKQKFIGLLVTLVIFGENLVAQNEYNDANTIYNSLDAQNHFGPQHFPALRKYYPGKTDNEIAAELAVNPFLKDYFDPTSTASVPNFLGSALSISSIGGFNVTNFADGLAKFLVKRFKEELSITFFQKFKKELDQSEDLRTLFPEAYKVLYAIDKDIYRFSVYLNTLREAFIKDLVNLYTNFKRFAKLPKYKQYFIDHPEINTIITNALYLIDKYASGEHPGDVLAKYNLEDLKFSDPVLQQNIRSSVEIVQAFSASFRSISPEHYWVPTDSVRKLLDKETSRNIYLGLMYQKYGGITFTPFSGNTLRFDTLLARARRLVNNLRDSLNEYKDFIETFMAHAQEVNEYLSELKNKKKEDIDYNDYYKLYDASIDLLQHAFTFIDLPYVNLKPDVEEEIKSQSNRLSFLAHSTGEFYIDIRTKNYSSAILNISGIVDTVLVSYNTDSTKKLIPAILKYGNFAAAVAQAQNSDDVEKTIESIALPAGSASIKKYSSCNIALNAFLGGFWGNEYLSDKPVKRWAQITGVYAPVGVTISKPIHFRSNKNASVSAFFSAIDIGSFASFRLHDDTTKALPEVSLKNIFAPGVGIIFGLPGIPVSLGWTWQYGPMIREIKQTEINVSDKPNHRWQFFLAVDIPIVNFYTKSK